MAYSSRRRGRARRIEAGRPRSVKAEAKPVDVVELRKQLGDFKKQVDIEIADSDISGLALSEATSYISSLAEAKGLDPNTSKLHLIRASGYRYSSSRPRWVIRGERDYTDAELRKEGPRLLEQKKRAEARAEAKRKKDLATIRRLAREHGLPDPTEETPKAKRTKTN
jgi:hypothetical protein